MLLRRLSAAAIAAATASALVAVAPGTAQAAPPPGAPTTSVQPVSVTLITGDRVTTHGTGVTVERGPGRAGMTFVSRTEDGHRYVIPADALPLLRSGRVDERLFDVTALAGFGYTGGTDLPLLVAYPNRQAAAGVRAATGADARVTRDLPKVGALAMRAGKDSRSTLWKSLTSARAKSSVERIWLDGKRRISLDVSVPQIGAPAAWQAGLDGTGVKVAVLDTGIDATHPDFAGQIVANENFTAAPTADDEVGHGTHVASTIAGSGAKSGGKYKGVAPGAKLAIGKVCETEFCDESAILAGMEWGAAQAPVVNMSLGGGDAPGIDPLEQAVEDLTAAHGTLFVIAAGNAGGRATVGSPGSADSALTVGAVDREENLADFSSRGPRVGDDAIKPDITAPGVDIVAAKAANGFIGDPAADGYVALSGTSMATPHVAGAAAILTQQHPDWSPRQRKTALMGSAKPNPELDVFEQGAGRVDVARAIRQTVSVDEGSISFGRQEWPHDDDVPVTRTVTYRNAGTAAVTLTLALETDAEDTFSLAATSLTVPAGGTATTTVTADTRPGDTDGFRTGRLVATAAGDVRVETPFAVNREVESYDVTFRHTESDGQPAVNYLTGLNNLETGEMFDIFGDGESTAEVRLPKGDYGMFSWIYEDETDLTMLVQTRLVVAGAQTVRLDARKGKAFDITVPRKDARPTLIAVNASWSGPEFVIGASALADTYDQLKLAQIGPRAAEETFFSSINAAFAKLDAEGSSLNSPFTYDLGYGRAGRFYDGFVKRVQPSDLATVRAKFAEQSPPATGLKSNWVNVGDPGGTWATLSPFMLPFQRTEWLNTDGRARWSGEFIQELPSDDPEAFPEWISGNVGPERKLDGGATYQEQWNNAVFAPSAAGDIDVAIREGEMIYASVPLFGDGSGHIGWSNVDSVRTALYAGDTLIGEVDDSYGEFAVPAGEGRYRLEASATRSAPFRLSTSVSGSWTFTSAADGRLPMSSVRISPRVDQHNVAPAGVAYDVPLTVGRIKNSGAKANKELTAEVSYDDGATWLPAAVRGAGDNWTAKVTHPAGPGSVSLRVKTKDAAANTATITVLRAYAIA